MWISLLFDYFISLTENKFQHMQNTSLLFHFLVQNKDYEWKGTDSLLQVEEIQIYLPCVKGLLLQDKQDQNSSQQSRWNDKPYQAKLI